MEERLLKIELPLPKLPTSRAQRFSLLGLFGLISLTAFGFALYSHGQRSERARQGRGEFHLVVSANGLMTTQNYKCTDIKTIYSLVNSDRIDISSIHLDRQQSLTWPPRIWIRRADANVADLETSIKISCGGTRDEPVLTPICELQAGDRVFVDFRSAKEVANSIQRTVTRNNNALNGSSVAATRLNQNQPTEPR